MRKLLLCLASVWLLAPSLAAAQQPSPSIEVTVNQSVVFRLVESAKRISVTQPEIAEVIVAEPNQLLINGKAIGITSLTVWDVKGVVSTFNIIVTVDVISLRRRLKLLFPDEKIEVSASGVAIVLKGEVSNEVVYDKVLAVARGYLPPKPPEEVAPAAPQQTTVNFGRGPRLPTTGTAFAGGGQLAFLEERDPTDSARWPDKRNIPEIIDLLTIKNFRQIELKVIVAEISLSKAREVGMDFTARGNNSNITSNILGDAGFSSTVANLAYSYFTDRLQIITFFRLLQNRDIAEILAQPNLVIKNGRSGGFLAGGEFPFPIPEDFDTVGIEFKPFGVRLDFVPTITWSGAIDLRIFPEVSEIDESISLSFLGFDVPGLRVRRTVSRIEMKEGETLVLSGLLDKRTIRQMSKLPFFGDIPVLGSIFRATALDYQERELIFVITPRIVNALREDKKPLPPTGNLLPYGEKPKLPDFSRYDSPDMSQVPLPSRRRAPAGQTSIP